MSSGGVEMGGLVVVWVVMAGDMESTYGEVVEPVGFHCGVGRGVLGVDVGVAGITIGDVVVLVSSRRYIQNDYNCNTGRRYLVQPR